MNEADKLKQKLNTAITTEIGKWKLRRTFEQQKKDFVRRTKLSIETMIQLFLTMEGGVLEDELPKAGLDVTPAAFSQRRKAIDETLLEEIFQKFNRLCNDKKLYHGYRVLAVDGTAVNIARNPKDSSTFITKKNFPKGYNQMTVTVVYDLLSKTYVDYDYRSRDERSELDFMLEWNDRFTDGHGRPLIVCDRGYESYSLIAYFQTHNDADFLIRVKQDKGAMREIAKLPMEEFDMDLDFTVTTTQTNADKAAGYVFIQTQKAGKTYSPNTRAARWRYPSPFRLKFRVVRVWVDDKFETLITSLPRKITAAEIKELYHARWGIELAFRELKYSIALNRIHGRSREFAIQELSAALITANFVSRLASEIIIKKADTKYNYKVNRRKAVRLCREYLREQGMTGQELVEQMAKYLVAERPDRGTNERNLKPKSFHGFVYRIAS